MRGLRPGPLALHLLLAVVTAGAVFATHRGLETAFAPDTRYYAASALHMSGLSQQEAQSVVAAYTASLGYETPAVEVLFGWGLVGPRLVYPLLSTPFVAVAGISGLVVVPVLAYAAAVQVMLRAGSRTVPAGVVAAVLMLFLASTKQVLFGSIMLTESLAMLLVALIALQLPTGGESVGRRRLVVLAALMTVLAFTRQSTLIPAGAAAVAYLGSVVDERTPRTPWLPVAAVASGCAVGWQLLQAVVFPGFSQLEQWYLKTGATSMAQALAGTPELAWHIVATDLGVMAREDRALLVLLGLAALAAVVRVRHADGRLLIGALLAVVLYNITNGTPTQFRYGEPAMVFVVTAVAALLARLARPAPAGAQPPARTRVLSGRPSGDPPRS